jgi:methionyl-tRNA formyltransferase
VVVVAAYGLILPTEVLTAAPRGAVNVHASLLPRWRGAAPVQRAILAGDKETGITIMLMDEGVDTGDVLAKRATPIGVAENSGDLTDRLAAMGAELLIETLPAWLAGELAPAAQDAAGATYAHKLEAIERLLDWRESAQELAYRVRALAPAPGAQLETSEGAVKVLAAHTVSEEAVSAGEVALVDGVPRIGCGSGVLVLDLVQPPGGKPMTGRAYCNGRPAFARDRLPLAVPA